MHALISQLIGRRSVDDQIWRETHATRSLNLRPTLPSYAAPGFALSTFGRTMMKKVLRKAGLGVVMAAAVATTAVTVTAAPAEAAIGWGRVQLCSFGNYATQLKFLRSSGTDRYSEIVPPTGDRCETWDYPANTTTVQIKGWWNTSDSSFYMGELWVADQSGHKIYTYGETTDWSFTIAQ